MTTRGGRRRADGEVRDRGPLYAPVGALLETYDALLCPTVGTRGLVAGDDYVGHGLEVGGRQLERYFDAALTPVFNIMSRCPVLNVPSGFADNGVPTGLQIAGRTYDDVTRVPGRRGARAGAPVVRRPRAAAGARLRGRRVTGALLEIDHLSAELPVEGEMRTVLHDVVAARSAPARPSGSWASRARASR